MTSTATESAAPPPRPGGSILGTRVLRTEDPGLLRGENRYLDDLDVPGKLHAVFARAEVAHAILDAVHVDDALAVPGVVAVYTGDGDHALGVAPHHAFIKVDDDFARPPLAVGKVRFVGEAIALVVAESLAAASDGAAAVWADYDRLPAVADPHDALAAGAPLLFDAHGSNIAVADVAVADVAGAESHGSPATQAGWFETSAGADPDRVVVRGRYVNQRMAVVPMETNGCLADWGDDGRLTFYASTQMPHGLADQLAPVLGIDRDRVRVITPQVGGGFGGKAGVCAEYSAIAAAARTLRRPVAWHSLRGDDLVSLPHSRGQVQYAELACRRDGTFEALRVRLVGDAGAYPNVGAYLPAGTKRMSHGIYNFGAIDFDVVVAVTNTTPMGAYRGAGRPEATALLERLVDHAALELGIDPFELRRRNLIDNTAFPFATLTGLTYDTGAYATPLDLAADEIGYVELRTEQRRRRDAGERSLLGIGVASYVEITAGGGDGEFGAVEVHDDGSATVRAGTLSHGQGHQTAFAMLVSELTGIPIDRIRLLDGDTDLVPRGGGTGGSRSLQVGGSAVNVATTELVERAREAAATLLEAAAADVVLDRASGTFSVAGVPAISLTWADLARRTTEQGGEPLAADAFFTQDSATFPFGTHVAVVEVDLETGAVVLRRHLAVDDCGTVLNPLLVEGQQHGGIAAGAGQALFEEVRYDPDGNPLTANLADYTIPSADVLPSFETRSTETPTPLNPLGAKGIGEAATIGSTPAVQNAVIDALAHLGVRHIDLPCTPQRVWETIEAARAGTPPDPWHDPPDVFDRLRAERATSTVDESGLSAAEGI